MLNVFLTGENKGICKGKQYWFKKKVKTKYALVLNPDTILEKNTIKNFLISRK